MRVIGKIHFIHHFEKGHVPANLGDWMASPYYYFPDFFDRYTCVIHSVWAVLWHEIEKSDVVILGGGGLIDNSNALNGVINRLFDTCDNVVLWGVGTHKYNKNNVFGKETATEPIDFGRASLVGVRDYEHPSKLPYVPCVSCLHPAFSARSEPATIVRKVGTITSALERTFAVSGVESSISNAHAIGILADYIRTSQVMLVSSYHGAYWSMLLGRKTILPVSRLGVDKYRYFRHEVAICEVDEFDETALMELTRDLPDCPDFLEESRRLNLEFFVECSKLIEDCLTSDAPIVSDLIASKRIAQLEFTVIDLWNEIRRLNRRIALLEKEVN